MAFFALDFVSYCFGNNVNKTSVIRRESIVEGDADVDLGEGGADIEGEEDEMMTGPNAASWRLLFIRVTPPLPGDKQYAPSLTTNKIPRPTAEINFV